MTDEHDRLSMVKVRQSIFTVLRYCQVAVDIIGEALVEYMYKAADERKRMLPISFTAPMTRTQS
jgi:hypothetical protein